MTLKSIGCSLFFVLLMQTAFGQGYLTSLGVRVGDYSNFHSAGLTLQQRILKKGTLEAVAQSNFSNNTTLHLLGEYHQDIISRYFNFYLGAGISSGWEKGQTLNSSGALIASQNQTLGADLIAGVELTMLHWNISLDYKPNFNITGRETWYQGQVGISVRAVLWNDSDLKKRKKEKEREKRKKERAKEKAKNGGKTHLEVFLDDLLK